MAVGTHELAFFDLCEDQGAVVPLQHGTHVADLQLPRQVIPVHRCRVEDATAIRAGSQGLDSRVPRDELLVPPTLLADPGRARPLVIGSVIGFAAVLAPGLMTRSSPVERLKRANEAALSASL